MTGNITIAFAAAFLMAYLTYRQMAKRATAGDFVKTITPPLVVGVLTFLIVLTLLWATFR